MWITQTVSVPNKKTTPQRAKERSAAFIEKFFKNSFRVVVLSVVNAKQDSRRIVRSRLFPETD